MKRLQRCFVLLLLGVFSWGAFSWSAYGATKAHGWYIDRPLEESWLDLLETKQNVSDALGPPSLVESQGAPLEAKPGFDGDVWYYMSYEETTFLFASSDTYQVLVFLFDKDGKVVEYSAQEDIPGSRRSLLAKSPSPVTTIYGKRFGIGEQILGNLKNLGK